MEGAMNARREVSGTLSIKVTQLFLRYEGTVHLRDLERVTPSGF